MTRLDRVRLPDDLVFVIGSSGVRARKSRGAKGAYNNAVELAHAGLACWNRAQGTDFGTLGELVSDPSFSLEKFVSTVDSGDLERDGAIRDRVSQFHEETCMIVPESVRALKSGNLAHFGQLVRRSQEMTDKLLRNQVPETRFLAADATANGALAASGFGAGFGGSVWALVNRPDADGFMKRWMASYGKRFPDRLRNARFFMDPTGPGAFVVGADPGQLLLEPKL